MSTDNTDKSGQPTAIRVAEFGPIFDDAIRQAIAGFNDADIEALDDLAFDGMSAQLQERFNNAMAIVMDGSKLTLTIDHAAWAQVLREAIEETK